MPSAGKHATGVKHRKNATSAKLITLKQQHVGSDWLEHFIRNFKPITKQGKIDTWQKVIEQCYLFRTHSQTARL